MSNAAIFDQNFYLTNNADVVVAISQGNFANALDHFTKFGGKELRNPNEFFDMSYYAINNADVLNAVSAGGLNNVFDHFVNFGETENRAPSVTYATFDSDAYLAANADVAAAVTAGTFTSALDHFIAFGQNESRPGAISVVAPVSGSSFSLTTGLDSLTGTSNNDTFAGIDDGSATSTTSTLGDTIDGGAGTDSVTITSNQGNGDTAAGSQLPTLTNVENLTVIESTEHEDINISTNSALTTLTLSNGSSDADGELDVTVAAGQTLNLTQFVDGDTSSDNANEGDVEIESAATVTSVSIGVSQVGAAASVATDADVDLLLNGTGVATLELASTGANTNYVAIENAGAALRTVNVTGSANILATAVADGVTTFNASAATGNVTASFGTGNDTVTGGSGDDTFIFAAGALTAADTVDGGTGTNRLTVTDVDVSGNAAALMTEIQASTNISVLGYAATTQDTGVLDANAVSTIDSFVVTGAITDDAGANGAAGGAGIAGVAGSNAAGEAFTYAGVENDDTLEFDSNITGGAGGNGGNGGTGNTAIVGGAGGNGNTALVLTPELDGGSNTASITLDSAAITGGEGGDGGAGNTGGVGAVGGAGGAAGDGGIAISAATIETLNINSIGTSANSITGGAAGTVGAGGIANITDGAAGAVGTAGTSITVNTNATINVTGTQNIDIGTIVGTNATIDATNFTGNLTVVAEAGNNTIIGGSGADTMNGSTGIDVLTGGAGADDFQFTIAANATGGTPSASVFERITDFNNGADEIDFTATTLTIDTAVATAVAGTAQINSEGFATFETTDNTLTEKLTAAENAIANGGVSAGDIAIFEHSGSTYVFVAGDNIGGLANDDAFIQLTGVTGLSNSTITGGDLFLA